MNLRGLCRRFVQADSFAPFHVRVLDHLERLEAGLFVQLQLGAKYRSHTSNRCSPPSSPVVTRPAFVRELADRVHPDSVLLLPFRFLRRGPAEEIRHWLFEPSL